ncbi:MAG: hypothetical protein AAF998_23300 [Bacteroidota bacterium]
MDAPKSNATLKTGVLMYFKDAIPIGNVNPDAEIWHPPKETPGWVVKLMPGPDMVGKLFALKYPNEKPPDGWTDFHEIAMLNSRRKEVFDNYTSGHYAKVGIAPKADPKEALDM